MTVKTMSNLFLDAVESTTTYKKYIFGVNRNHTLFRVLTASLRWNIYNRSFKEFKKSLLYSLSTYISCNRRIITLSCYFINFIYKNNRSEERRVGKECRSLCQPDH